MRRHTFDPISFVLGALCAVIGVAFLFGRADIGDLHLAVVWPIPLILIGLLMLIGTQRRSRERARLEQPPAVVRERELEPAPAVGEANHGLSDEPWGEDEDTHDLLPEDDEPR
jgi:hypothetical protein